MFLLPPAHGELRVYPEFTEGNQVSGDTSFLEGEGAGHLFSARALTSSATVLKVKSSEQ